MPQYFASAMSPTQGPTLPVLPHHFYRKASCLYYLLALTRYVRSIPTSSIIFGACSHCTDRWSAVVALLQLAFVKNVENTQV